MLSIVARGCQSFKNGAREGRWETQGQLTRRVFVETSISWAGSDTGRHRAAISERKVSWHVCFSGSSGGQSAGIVVCNCMGPGSAFQSNYALDERTRGSLDPRIRLLSRYGSFSHSTSKLKPSNLTWFSG